MIKILYVSTQSSGLSTEVEIPEGTTVSAFFRQKYGEEVAASDYSFVLNGQAQPATTTVLQEGDRLSIGPRKMEGAA